MPLTPRVQCNVMNFGTRSGSQVLLIQREAILGGFIFSLGCMSSNATRRVQTDTQYKIVHEPLV